MCKETCECKKDMKAILLSEEEKDLLVTLLNETLFKIQDLVVANRILDKIDMVFPIMEE